MLFTRKRSYQTSPDEMTVIEIDQRAARNSIEIGQGRFAADLEDPSAELTRPFGTIAPVYR